MTTSLSVVIPTLNEEQDLPICLDSVKDIADEIIVVDSGSTDKTEEIAKKFGAKFVYHQFKSFKDQRNFCDSLATGDWILSTEADVRVPKELASEIVNTINKPKYSAYYIERINYIWGKPIMHTDWGPHDDNHIWLYKKGTGSWQSEVHEAYVIKSPAGQLKNRLIHHNYDTVSEFIDKLNSYTDLAARNGSSNNDSSCLYDFFKRYFYKLGFLDGYHGLFLSYLMGVYHLTLNTKRKLLQ